MTGLGYLAADGRFPFGQPNEPRDVTWRGRGNPRLLVVGVYPSALHVGWNAPTSLPKASGSNGRVFAMAVDVEPEVFWRGDGAADRVDAWKSTVGFVDGDEVGCDGHAVARGNGPSGRTLDSYLAALGIAETEAAYLDVHPVFVVHHSADSQGAAVRREYDPLVGCLASGRMESSIPARPSSRVLPRLAAERFGAWLVDRISSLDPEFVITLGAESWDALAQVRGIAVRHDSATLTATKATYGREGTLTVAGKSVPWIPLVHPGLLDKDAAWRQVHESWMSDRQGANAAGG